MDFNLRQNSWYFPTLTAESVEFPGMVHYDCYLSFESVDKIKLLLSVLGLQYGTAPSLETDLHNIRHSDFFDGDHTILDGGQAVSIRFFQNGKGKLRFRSREAARDFYKFLQNPY